MTWTLWKIAPATAVPLAPDAMAAALRDAHGSELSPVQVREQLTARGWGGYGPWAERVLDSYEVAAFEAKTGNPF